MCTVFVVLRVFSVDYRAMIVNVRVIFHSVWYGTNHIQLIFIQYMQCISEPLCSHLVVCHSTELVDK